MLRWIGGTVDGAVEVEDLRLAESLSLGLLELLAVDIVLRVGLVIAFEVVWVDTFGVPSKSL